MQFGTPDQISEQEEKNTILLVINNFPPSAHVLNVFFVQLTTVLINLSLNIN